MKTNTSLRNTKANALRARKALKVKKLKNLRNNILLGALFFIGYLFTVFIDANGFLSYSVPVKLLCISVIIGIFTGCIVLTGGMKIIFSK